MNQSSAGRLLRTLWHLRPGQIAAQARVRLLPGWHDPSWVAARTPPPPPAIRWRPVGDWLLPDAHANTGEAIHAGWFTFAGERFQCGWPPAWDAPSTPLLWRYNLHYLDWIWALPGDEPAAAARDWCRRHGPAPRAVGWEPYPTSLRLANLCLLAGRAGGAEPDLWASIWRQAEHLSRRLERHLLGNHLLENGIALALTGACFAGPDADRWRETGLGVLRAQLPEQVLSDGMHFERSPMYQARLAYALALAVNTGDPRVREVAAAPLERMLTALATLVHPDGEIALFNDAAFGVAHAPGRVLDFAAAALGIPRPRPLDALPDGGYFRGANARGDLVLCDAGPLGPDYLPGHAHGDMLSFELSLGGRRTIVDAGTFDYVPSDMRRYCRSTAAHNTVTVDDADQAEFWGTFRVGRRGRPHDVRHEPAADGFALEGWHDGFRRVAGGATHRRRFRWHGAGVLLVHDEVRAQRPARVATRLHLHPDCVVVEASGPRVRAAIGDAPFTVAFTADARTRIEEGWHCPRFGERRRSRVIVAEATGTAVDLRYAVAAGHDVELLPGAAGVSVAGATHGW